MAETHLFFGCRGHDEHLCQSNIDSWEKDGVLQMHLALSRDSVSPKMYVQDQIRAKGKIIANLILKNDSCRYYVCGDARMADFCYEAVIEALRQHGGLSRSKAVFALDRMRVEERWQYDLWGISAYMDTGGSFLDEKKKFAKHTGQKALRWLAQMNAETLGLTEETW